MPQLFSIIKFGSKENLEKLMSKGQMRFGPLKEYRESLEKERGDRFEGAIEIVNEIFTDVKCEHPTLGTFNFKVSQDSLSTYIQTDISPYCVFSSYALTFELFENKNSHKIDERMSEFGDHALLITNPNLFISRAISKLKELNYKSVINLTNYKNLSQRGNIDADIFTKTSDLSHQLELRFLIEAPDDDAIFIEIGSISDICFISKTRDLLDTEYKAKRKE